MEQDLTKYKQAILSIVKEQSLIVGPLAVTLLNDLSAFLLLNGSDVDIKSDPIDVLERVVSQYKKVFGQASVEVCRKVVSNPSFQFQPSELPRILQSTAR